MINVFNQIVKLHVGEALLFASSATIGIDTCPQQLVFVQLKMWEELRLLPCSDVLGERVEELPTCDFLSNWGRWNLGQYSPSEVYALFVLGFSALLWGRGARDVPAEDRLGSSKLFELLSFFIIYI